MCNWQVIISNLTVFIHLLFCRGDLSVELLRHPGDERRLRLHVKVAPAPLLIMHRDVLACHQEFSCKVVLMLQIQNILHRERRGAGRTGIHPRKVMQQRWEAVWRPAAAAGALSGQTISGGGPEKIEIVNNPPREKGRYISVTPSPAGWPPPPPPPPRLRALLTLQEHPTLLSN